MASGDSEETLVIKASLPLKHLFGHTWKQDGRRDVAKQWANQRSSTHRKRKTKFVSCYVCVNPQCSASFKCSKIQRVGVSEPIRRILFTERVHSCLPPSDNGVGISNRNDNPRLLNVVEGNHSSSCSVDKNEDLNDENFDNVVERNHNSSCIVDIFKQ